ncbi:MAG TPA: hypothetical protein VLA79_04025, partial [Polyangia bacterium]|nr:hypothetical protein [Polyangia bacterium]
NGRQTIGRMDLGEEMQRRLTPPIPRPVLSPSFEQPTPRAAEATGAAGTSAVAAAIRSLLERGLSEREAREVVTLRNARFRVGEAEVKLGYSGQARTLSRRLQWLSLKVLSLHDMDLDRAASLLAGEEPGLQPIVVRRLQKVLDGVSGRLAEPDDELLAKLPADYRRHALSVVAALRRRRQP